MISQEEYTNKLQAAQPFIDAVEQLKQVLQEKGLEFNIDIKQIATELKTKTFSELMQVSASTKFKYGKAATDQAKLELIDTEVSLTDDPTYIEVSAAVDNVITSFKKLQHYKVFTGSLEELYSTYNLDVKSCLDSQLIILDPVALVAFNDIVNNVNKIIKFLTANGNYMSGYDSQRVVWEFMQQVCKAETVAVNSMISKITGYKVDEHKCQWISKKYDMSKYKAK